MIKENLLKIFKNKWLLLIYILSSAILLILWSAYFDSKIMFWNHGSIHTYIDIVSSIVISLLFPLFIISFLYRSYLIGKINKELKEEKGNTKNGIMWIISWVIGIIISGSTCCGLTLATTFGLLPIMNLLPFSWLEVKVLSMFMLMYSLYSILSKDLSSCELKLKRWK